MLHNFRNIEHRDAAANFGPDTASGIGALFARIDGVKLPAPSGWIDGPGDILPNEEPWETVEPRYAFVDELAGFRPQVHGAAALARFDYWLNQFLAFRLVAELGCTAGALDRTMASIGPARDPAARTRAPAEALPLRLRLAMLWTQLLRTEIAGADTTGELGTIANLEQHSRRHQHFLTRHDDALRTLLGCDLPLAAWPARDYAGPARLIVPAVRTAAAVGESLQIRAIAVCAGEPGDVTLLWRHLGEREYHRQALDRLGRHVFAATLPAPGTDRASLAYHLEATLDGGTVRWPASDAGADQTVVAIERD